MKPIPQEVLDALDDVVVWYHTGLFFKAGSRYYAHKLYVASSTQHKQIKANANRPELDMQVSSFYFSLINFSSTLEVRITPPQIIMLHIHTNTKTVIKIIANAHTHTDKYLLTDMNMNCRDRDRDGRNLELSDFIALPTPQIRLDRHRNLNC